MAMTASCLACQSGETIEEYCTRKSMTNEHLACPKQILEAEDDTSDIYIIPEDADSCEPIDLSWSELQAYGYLKDAAVQAGYT